MLQNVSIINRAALEESIIFDRGIDEKAAQFLSQLMKEITGTYTLIISLSGKLHNQDKQPSERV